MNARRASPVHAVIGEDSCLAEEQVASILESRLGSSPSDDAVETLHGDECSWTNVADTARSRSLFVVRRAVVVRRADEIKGSEDAFVGYLADPDPDTTLVLVAAKPDRRRGVWRRVADLANVISAAPLKGRALRSNVNDRIRRRGILLDDSGLQELLDRVGADLRRLMGELDKLEAYALGRKTRMSAEEVARVLGRGFAAPLYKVADALCARQTSRVLALVEELLEEGEPPLRIMATLHRAWRQISAAREVSCRRGNAGDLAARLGVPAFKLDSLVEASRSWTEEDLRRALRAFSKADRGLKMGAPARPVLAGAIVAAGRGSETRPSR
ncbi:MAG: DNA polymerase III subunit delta [Vicinamibacteria bacterium]|nr:DNA polymerase III subunit delta [Vicinamibacteria bacterium]